MKRVVVFVVGVVVVLGAVVGCTDPAPVVVSAGVVSDTSVQQGPYEVRVLAVDEAGFKNSTLTWSAQGPLEAARQGSVSLVVVVDPTVEQGTRMSALIPGQPIGTVVDWTLLVCDTGSRCTPDPDNGRPYEFNVGPLPSSPSLSFIDPVAGPSSGGTRVEIHGTDLRPSARVRFGDVEAKSVEWLREDLVAAVTAHSDPGVVDVRIENPDGHAAVLHGGYTYTPSPHVDAVNPRSGPEAGGTAVVVTGNGFTLGSLAFFDGVPCTHQVLQNDTTIACDTPRGHHGQVDVDVRALDGGVGTFFHGYEYIQAPVIDDVTPDQGSSDGGDVVTIGGDGFLGGATVEIGGAPCTDVNVESLTVLTCTTPGGTPGAADIVVTNPDGQQDTLPGGFGFIGPPVVVEVDPPLVPAAGGVLVRILGAGLGGENTVTFGGSPGAETAVSDDEIDATVPPVPAAINPAPASGLLSVDVVVQRTQAQDTRSGTLPAGLTYFWPPEVDGVTPPSGPTSGGTNVVINGRFFHDVDGGTLTVQIGGVDCINPVIVSSTEITCTTAPGPAGFVDVTVGNADNSSGTEAHGFFYIAPPLVISTDPPQGPTFGGDDVTIHGDFFQPGALAFIGGAPCSGVNVVNAQTITCISPPGAEGHVDVRVLNVDGQSGTGAQIYEYLGVAVTPDHGLPVGFTKVSVRSAGMQPNATIFFGDQVASCTFVSSREFSCQTPASSGDPGSANIVDVKFVNPDGTTETGTHAFHYRVYVDHSDDFPFDGENANDVDLADFDGDGDLDVVVSTGTEQSVFGTLQAVPQASGVWENDGHGHFTRHDINLVSVANNASVADANNDGKPDILFGCTNGTGPVLLENDGDFHFHQVNLGLSSVDDSFDAEFMDANGDGKPDIYNLSAGCDPNNPPDPNCDPSVIGPDNLLLQTNNGFNDQSSLIRAELAWVHDHKMIGVDLDGDGDQDVVIVTNNTSFPTEQNRIMRNRVNEGLGFVAETPSDLLNLLGDLYDLEAGDVDGDGLPDVVTTVCDGSFGEVLLRNDNGTLVNDEAALPSLTPSCTVGAALVDLDDDGDLDIIFGGTVNLNDTHTQMRVFINKGDGTFVDASAALPSFAHDHIQLNNFAVGDIDGDRDVDIIVAGGAPYFETQREGHVLVLHLE